jgi:hypothetical protein
MIKLTTKITFVTSLICCATLIAKAQLGYNYAKYDLGVSVGFNTVHGDAQTTASSPSVDFNLTYNQTPFTNFVFEAQLGRLAGGDSLKTSTGRQFKNDFSAFIFRGQLQAGEFLDYSGSRLNNALKNLYASVGIGYVINRIVTISRVSHILPGFYTAGQNNSQEIFIPFRIGYEFKLFNTYQQPSVKFDLGYGYNYVLGDGLDGFATTAGHHDAYSQYTIGVKFAIGNADISYRKQIQY